MKRGFFVSKVVDREKVEDFFNLIKMNQVGCDDLIRLGGDGDGGYMIPDELSGIEECFSPGVSVLADFERDLVSRGVCCYLSDYSVEESPFKNQLVDFEKKYLGVVDDDVFSRLATWVERKQKSSADLILQMDIEGAEYRVLLDASDELLCKFRVIVIEFHHLNRLFEVFGFDLIDLTFRKLLRQFDIVHIHPNNCRTPVDHYGFSVPPVMEFTFLRKGHPVAKHSLSVGPVSADKPNVKGVPDVALPECWRRST